MATTEALEVGGDAATRSGVPFAQFDALVQAVAALPDAALDRQGSARNSNATLRQVLVQLSAYEQTRVQVAGTLSALGWEAPVAVRHLQWAPIGRARLEASLVGVSDGLIDRCPFPGEWSVRQQLAHCELTDMRQRQNSTYCAGLGVAPSRAASASTSAIE